MGETAKIFGLFDKKVVVESYPLESRQTEELVIGMIGPIASGVSFTAAIIENSLKSNYKYDGRTIKVSRFIEQNASKVGGDQVPTTDKKRTEKLQQIGSAIRQKLGLKYLADKCIEEINMGRGSASAAADPRRYVTILDSLKNKDEIERLREVYGENFVLFGVFAPESVRKKRLLTLGHSAPYADEIMQRDEDEGVVYGQRVRDAMQLADFFVRNDGVNEEKLTKTVDRFLNILFGTAVETPTNDETAMTAAMSAATGSACMSRQVGAVITSKAGDIIGSGTNDVPKFNGGLYKSTDNENDNRCFKWRNHQCHNDERKEKLFSQARQNLVSEKLVPKAKEPQVQKALKKTGMRSLIEFSRSIHAEMEAIISVARSGKPGLVGGTLYSTTFPCHGCARHIVASGITKVVYIEPYAKSLALELHDDSISVSDGDQEKVKFLQYEGVAPRNMIRFFKERGERKLDGKLNLPLRSTAKPATHGMLDGLKEREQLVVAAMGTAESKIVASGIEDGQKG